MSGKTSVTICVALIFVTMMKVPELGFLLFPAIIIGVILINIAGKKDNSQQSIKDYGADLYKPREKWTERDHENYKTKQREKASQKGYDSMQDIRRYAFEKLKIELAKGGIYDIKDAPVELMSDWIRKSPNTLPTVEMFQEYANIFPLSLEDELMEAVYYEAECAGTKYASESGGYDGMAIDKIQAIKEYDEAREKLLKVMDKCDDHIANNNNNDNLKKLNGKKGDLGTEMEYNRYKF